jgi:hypothetical protein
VDSIRSPTCFSVNSRAKGLVLRVESRSWTSMKVIGHLGSNSGTRHSPRSSSEPRNGNARSNRYVSLCMRLYNNTHYLAPCLRLFIAASSAHEPTPQCLELDERNVRHFKTFEQHLSYLFNLFVSIDPAQVHLLRGPMARAVMQDWEKVGVVEVRVLSSRGVGFLTREHGVGAQKQASDRR